MKKIIASLMLSAGLLSVQSAWSFTSSLGGYSSSLHPASTVSNLLHPPTDITVVNASSSYLYAMVPNSPVNDYLTPGYNDHIYNYDPNLWWTYLVLQDNYHATFFAESVCRLAIVTVYGYTGHFTVNVDSDLCN